VKIALVSPYDLSVPGGVNNHIRHLAREFSAHGHECIIVGPASAEPMAAGCPVAALGRPIPWRVGGSIARISLSLRMAKPVRRLLDEHRFDIVHVHEPFVPQLPIQFLRYSEAVNVGTFHAAAESNIYYVYGRRLIGRWIRRMDGKIAVSEAAARHVSRYFPGYYNIIPNGIDVESFARPREKLPELAGGPNILFVGRPEKRKGLSYLLRAFVGVKERMPTARLVVVGAGSFDRYERRMRRAGVKDVIFRSHVPFDELPRYHQSCQVFCAPNTGFESQGIILLEAMAAGMPIVASNIEGFALVITHGVEGVLVPPKNAEALSAALVDLLQDEPRRRRMGEEGRQRAQQYDWRRVAQRVLSYYERLIYERQAAHHHAPAGGLAREASH
jgi:phosphatidylinositol alpha-mannosyltransferase